MSLEEFSKILEYNENGRFFHFSAMPETISDIEASLFLEFLKPVKEKEVCRYTSLDSLFQMLNYKSYRMASIISMNDRSEIDYAYKQMGLFYTPLNSLSAFEMQQLNKSFISSCTWIEKKDNLTMYRLYGDASRGVCLVFEYDATKDHHNLLLRRVSYGESRNTHTLLDRLAVFLKRLSTGHRLRFRLIYLDTWKHFFKSSDYALEDEIRLLYIQNTEITPDGSGWVNSHPDHIISKYVVFNFSNSKFPLKLKTIVLGPNCPDAAVNRRQLEVMLADQGLSGVAVELSDINSYRRS